MSTFSGVNWLARQIANFSKIHVVVSPPELKLIPDVTHQFDLNRSYSLKVCSDCCVNWIGHIVRRVINGIFHSLWDRDVYFLWQCFIWKFIFDCSPPESFDLIVICILLQTWFFFLRSMNGHGLYISLL